MRRVVRCIFETIAVLLRGILATLSSIDELFARRRKEEDEHKKFGLLEKRLKFRSFPLKISPLFAVDSVQLFPTAEYTN